MFCARCRQSIPDARDVDAPCPRCSGAVLGEGRWLLVEAWGEAFEAVDLSTGARGWWPQPAALDEPSGDDQALDELFDAVFPELPAAADRAPSPEAEHVLPRASLGRRVARRLGVVGASVVLAAQLGFATAPPPADYSARRGATEGHEHLLDQVLADDGVQRCLAAHRAMPRSQSDAPALLQITSDSWIAQRSKVTSTSPVLTGCLMSSAEKLRLPDGRYHLDVPITER